MQIAKCKFSICILQFAFCNALGHNLAALLPPVGRFGVPYSRSICASLVGTVVLLVAAHAQSPGTAPALTGQQTPAKATPDIEKVERLLAARRDYQLALEGLRKHYIKVGDIERAKWAEEELIQYHRIQKHAFILDLDVPGPGLKASLNIPEANELLKQAMSYKDKGWGNDFLDNQRRAELLLQQILTMYPESNKIGEVAYQLGDLYESKVYRDYRRAAMYFERSFQWNPNTQSDARMRAARLYDKYLSERTHAMDIYREVTTHETDPKRTAEAQKRMAEMSNKK
jgi:tetratricopeptide (TPR) repeat protein